MHIEGPVQDCGLSTANALETGTKPWTSAHSPEQDSYIYIYISKSINQLNEAKWHQMAAEILDSIGSGNGLLPNGGR